MEAIAAALPSKWRVSERHRSAESRENGDVT
jgi:hypothetical protein